MAEFWNLMVQSNTFNFAILMLIIAIVFAKIDLPGIIEKIRLEIASNIENAQKLQKEAQSELKKAKKAIKNTDTEVEEKLSSAKNSAKLLVDEINKNTKSQVAQIENNVDRVILAETKKVSTKLSHDTVNKAINLAKENIINKLASDPSLHNKLIEESITELDKIEL